MKRPRPSWAALRQQVMFVVLDLLLLVSAVRGEVLVEPKLIASDQIEYGDLGHALAQSGDVLVATAPYTEIDGVLFAGAAYIFLRDPATGAWAEHKKLVSQDRADFDYFGKSVAVNGDTIAVGVPDDDVAGVSDQGTVHVFERHAGGTDNWGEVVTLTDGSLGRWGAFGRAVALDGDLLAVGAPRLSENGGRVTIFERGRGGDDVWGKVATILDSDVGGAGKGDGSTDAYFGHAVALQGGLLLIGASKADVSHYGQDDGAAYLFARDAADRDRWTYVTRLVAHEAALCYGGRFLADLAQESPEVQSEVARCAREDSTSDNDLFGHAVALDGDTAAVGAQFADGKDGSRSAGALYIFQRDPEQGDRWSETARLTGSDPQARYFGGALALAGDILLVGADGTGIGLKYSQGAAHVFERNAGGPGHWGEVEKLIAADGFSGHRFGSAVVLDGPMRLIGARGDGAVYVHSSVIEPPPPEEPEEPAFSPMGELVDDTILKAPSGVVLGAVQNTVLERLPVWVHEVPLPSEQLPDGTAPVGPFFNAGAVETTLLSNDASFAVGLPVPADADPSQLGVAVLSPAELILDSEQSGNVWEVIGGDYDADDGLYFVNLPVLFSQGNTLVLVANSNPPAEPTRFRRSTESVNKTNLFEVTCDSSFPKPEACDDLRRRAAEHLTRAYKIYIEQGFPEPRLNKTRNWLDCSGSSCVILSETMPFKGIFFAGKSNRSSPCGGESTRGVELLGKYSASTSSIYICDPVPEEGEKLEAILSHELFHAHQAAFGPPRDKWVHEGTAEAAAGSLTSAIEPPGSSLMRNWPYQRSVRRIDETLLAPVGLIYNYEAQDFWVYLGRRDGHPLGYLATIINQGSETKAVDGQLRNRWKSSLAEEYWRWVKNQIMLEDEINFAPDGPGPSPPPFPLREPPCHLQTKAIEHNPSTLEPRLRLINFPSEKEAEFPISPLESQVVAITSEMEGSGFWVTVEAGGAAGGEFNHKVYLDQPIDIVGTACRDVEDGDRKISLVVNAKTYVVIANTASATLRPTYFRVRVSRPE